MTLHTPERRSQKDRRARHTSPLSLSSFFGSRIRYRRQEDRDKYYYVDRYSLASILVVLVTIILSAFDATFTLKLVSRGAQEANPVMDFFLHYGPVPFMIAKSVLTGFGLIWFLVHKNYTLIGKTVKVRHLLLGALLIYVVLISYELYLLVITG
ncbi:MAG: DUF5658 family protein [bacterium]